MRRINRTKDHPHVLPTLASTLTQSCPQITASTSAKSAPKLIPVTKSISNISTHRWLVYLLSACHVLAIRAPPKFDHHRRRLLDLTAQPFGMSGGDETATPNTACGVESLQMALSRLFGKYRSLTSIVYPSILSILVCYRFR